MEKYKEIFQSWISSINPSEEEKMLAKDRLRICLNCEEKREMIKKNKWTSYCNRCGCPISKKIFSPMFNPCPLKKWEDVDPKYLKETKNKDQKTMI